MKRRRRSMKAQPAAAGEPRQAAEAVTTKGAGSRGRAYQVRSGTNPDDCDGHRKDYDQRAEDRQHEFGKQIWFGSHARAGHDVTPWSPASLRSPPRMNDRIAPSDQSP